MSVRQELEKLILYSLENCELGESRRWTFGKEIIETRACAIGGCDNNDKSQNTLRFCKFLKKIDKFGGDPATVEESQ